MALDHQQIMIMHKKAHESGYATREKASDDIVFSRLTQWDESILSDVLTEYKGEFNIIRKERRRALKELSQNPVQVTFRPVDGADPDTADILNGVYRADCRGNDSMTAIKIATQDQVDCGFGAWRLTTEYKNRLDAIDNDQVIKRHLIHEANNVVFWDPNAKLQDKSDAAYCTVLTSYSEAGWKEYAKENDIDEDASVPNFSAPAQSYVYPWTIEPKKVRIGEFYHRRKKRTRMCLYETANGEIISYDKRDVKDIEDQMEASGYVKLAEKMIDKYVVEKYLVSGTKILKGPDRIAGEYIPIIPVYGEWSYVEGEEVYEGITRLAKDPQRLHNFQMSYLADIVAKGSRKKPFFNPDQIRGYEQYYATTGPEFNFPYYLLNAKDKDGMPLPQQPLGYMEQPEVPQALAGLVELTRNSIEDTTGPSMTSKSLDPVNTSGRAISLQHRRADSQQIDFLGALQIAMRHDAVVYQSMASQIYDTEREFMTLDELGNEGNDTLNMQAYNPMTGEQSIINDMSKGSFDVYTDIGPAYATVKEETRADIKEMIGAVAQINPELTNMLLMQYISMSEGADMKGLREWANDQLLISGIRQPKSEEDMMKVQQAQQQQQQLDPVTMALSQQAMAEAQKAEAQAIKAQADTIKSQTDAEKAVAQTAQILTETEGKQIDNVQKLMENLRNQSPVLRLPPASGGLIPNTVAPST